MRERGKAEVAMTMNELQATDALFGKLVMLLRMMTLQARMFGFSCLLAVSGDDIWCHLLSVPEMTSVQPVLFVCIFSFCFVFGYLKYTMWDHQIFTERHSQKPSKIYLESICLVQAKRRILQHSSHFLHGEPCQSIWQNTLLS